MLVGRTLKESRERSGLTQEQLAERMHLTKSCISKFENDHKEPHLSTFMDWIKHTNAQDMAIAILITADPIKIQQILEVITHSVPVFIQLIL